VPGAALLAFGHQLVQVAVLFYFAPRLGRAEETYGAFGAAATMLIWLYVISRLGTGAAFLNAVLWERRESRAWPRGSRYSSAVAAGTGAVCSPRSVRSTSRVSKASRMSPSFTSL